jgi:hypothetical protein
MSITPDDIADALWDVSEETVENTLAERDCFLYGLAKSIVSVACFNGDPQFLAGALDTCIKEAKEIQQELADKILQHKDDKRRFQASMADSYDGDDYQWRVA